jgi:hypothetical protein
MVPLEQSCVHQLRLRIARALVVDEQLFANVQLELARRLVDAERQDVGAIYLVQQRGLRVELVG